MGKAHFTSSHTSSSLSTQGAHKVLQKSSKKDEGLRVSGALILGRQVSTMASIDQLGNRCVRLLERVIRSLDEEGALRVRNGPSQRVTYYLGSDTVGDFAILKSGERTRKEELVCTVAEACGLGPFFVPSLYFEGRGQQGPLAGLSGILQPFLQDLDLKALTAEEILEGSVPFSTVLQTLPVQLQFGMDDAIPENFFLDTKRNRILHFDMEHDLPAENGMKMEDGEEATPPLRTALLAHPEVMRSLTGQEQAELRRIVEGIYEKGPAVVELLNGVRHQYEELHPDPIATAWNERAVQMRRALETMNGPFSLADFVLSVSSDFKRVKFLQLAAEFQTLKETATTLEALTGAGGALVIRRVLGDLCDSGNYLPDLEAELDDASDSDLQEWVLAQVDSSLEVFAQALVDRLLA